MLFEGNVACVPRRRSDTKWSYVSEVGGSDHGGQCSECSLRATLHAYQEGEVIPSLSRQADFEMDCSSIGLCHPIHPMCSILALEVALDKWMQLDQWGVIF